MIDLRAMLTVGSLLAFASQPNLFAKQQADPVHVKFHIYGLSEARANYETRFVKLILEASKPRFGPYLFSTSKEEMSLDRSLRETARGDISNIFTDPLSSALDLHLDKIEVIPVPVMKGLLGYRALIIHIDNQQQFSQLHSLRELKRLKPGQVSYWSDILVYESNEMEVVKGTNIEALFGMLERKRFDYFPLGITEVQQMLGHIKKEHPKLVILPNIYLHYAFPVYIHVCKCEPLLIKRIQEGLKIASANGQLEKLFTEHFGKTVKEIQSDKVRIIPLNNPLLPKYLEPNLDENFDHSIQRR